jgi:DNA ligase (NAD+)
MKKNTAQVSGKSSIVIFEDKQGNIELKADVEKDTIWATLDQVAELFGRDKSVISRHLKNIFNEAELDINSVVAKNATTAADGKIYMVDYYNLDAIVSVGYRVSSKKATQFRIWATGVLKSYIAKGYVIHQQKLIETRQRFEELQKTVAFIESKSHKPSLKDKTQDILELLSAYSKTLSILEQYDRDAVVAAKGSKAKFTLSYKNCLGLIVEVKKELSSKNEASDLFGVERGGAFEGAIKSVYQPLDDRKRQLEEEIPRVEAEIDLFGFAGVISLTNLSTYMHNYLGNDLILQSGVGRSRPHEEATSSLLK